MRAQGAGLGRVQHTLSAYVAAVPGISTLMSRIANRQTRDSTVLALVIAACICFTLWYLLGGSAPAAAPA